MGQYSPEPPRRHCIVHHTFDYVSGDRVLDTSPQALNGTIVGNVTTGHPGVVGQAARMRSRDADVEINGAEDFFPMPTITMAGWSDTQHPVPAGESNVHAGVTIEGTTFELSHDVPKEVDDWQFAALDYDGNVARLFYGNLDGELFRADEVMVGGGEVTDAYVEFNTVGWGYADDVRMYKSNVGADGVSNIHLIGYDHNSENTFGHHWENPGIPYRADNSRLAGTLGEEKDLVFRQLDFIHEARHIEMAGGEQLDRLAQTAGVRRREGEGDAVYRARIIGTYAAGRSTGTTEDVIQATAAIVGTDPENVQIDTSYDSDPGTVFILLRNEDIDDTELSTDDVTEILGDTVMAGHTVEVSRQQDNPFTVRSDVQTNDPALGLTSDSVSTGGTLTEDL